MTQFLSGAFAGVLVGGFVGFVSVALVAASKVIPSARRQDDEEQVEALIASRIQNEIVQGARLLN
ncbi:hypothetical protein [Rhizobium sp. LCM 4573]|uniref:hypothetical protein n=1 Tax=Rhizobium sp. LCM 4573 TaxID=1848291 RepID=UPI0008D98815|nr:hypothetical protein [Rhizobium sp. LCM 4573]OHV81643.1 hypothetical protein LCM4573_21410 [Rhizobium sp. LCM 4573]